jgi:hypothetical protein
MLAQTERPRDESIKRRCELAVEFKRLLTPTCASARSVEEIITQVGVGVGAERTV